MPHRQAESETETETETETESESESDPNPNPNPNPNPKPNPKPWTVSRGSQNGIRFVPASPNSMLCPMMPLSTWVFAARWMQRIDRKVRT